MFTDTNADLTTILNNPRDLHAPSTARRGIGTRPKRASITQHPHICPRQWSRSFRRRPPKNYGTTVEDGWNIFGRGRGIPRRNAGNLAARPFYYATRRIKRKKRKKRWKEEKGKGAAVRDVRNRNLPCFVDATCVRVRAEGRRGTARRRAAWNIDETRASTKSLFSLVQLARSRDSAIPSEERERERERDWTRVSPKFSFARISPHRNLLTYSWCASII